MQAIRPLSWSDADCHQYVSWYHSIIKGIRGLRAIEGERLHFMKIRSLKHSQAIVAILLPLFCGEVALEIVRASPRL